MASLFGGVNRGGLSSAFPLSGVLFSWLLYVCLYVHALALFQRADFGSSGAAGALVYGVT